MAFVALAALVFACHGTVSQILPLFSIATPISTTVNNGAFSQNPLLYHILTKSADIGSY